MTNFFTKKRICIFFEIVLWVSIIPMIWIGLYNHPSADDYSIGMQCRFAWVETHNIFLTIWAGIVRAYDDWRVWMGYFTSNFLMAFPPNVFGERAYIVSTPVLLLFLISSTKYLFDSIFSTLFGCEKYLSRTVSSIVLIVMIQCMVGRIEAFYWYCGASNYIITHSLCLFFFGGLINLWYSTKKIPYQRIAALSILGFFCGGGNQLSALNLVIVVFLVWFFMMLLKKMRDSRAKLLVIPSVFAVVGFLLNVFAPGNATRSAISTGMNPVKAVFISLFYYFKYCMGEWLTWPVVIMIVLLIPFFLKMFSESEYEFKCPLIIVILGYGLTAAMMTPPLYAVGNIVADRLKAMTFIMFILTIVISEAYVIGWICNQLKYRNIQIISKNFTINDYIVIVSCCVVCIFAAGLTIIPEPYYFTSSSAVTDLLNGSAKAFSEELDARIEIFESGKRNVEVKRLVNHPDLLFFCDIDGDYNAWIRDSLCKYYDLDSITVVDH